MKGFMTLEEYLASQGRAANGSHEARAALIEQYAKLYNAAWKREYRRTRSSVTAYFAEAECRALDRMAAACGRTRSQLVKDIALDFIGRLPFNGNPDVYNRIIEAILLVYYQLKDLHAHGHLSDSQDAEFHADLSSIKDRIEEHFFITKQQ